MLEAKECCELILGQKSTLCTISESSSVALHDLVGLFASRIVSVFPDHQILLAFPEYPALANLV